MEISSSGKFSFKLKNKNLTVVLDPFNSKEKADAIVYSGSVKELTRQIAGGVNRENIFIIDKEGEYELSGVDFTVRRVASGSLMTTITMDGVEVVYLGALMEDLEDKEIEKVAETGVLIVPLHRAVNMINKIEPSYALLSGWEDVKELEKFIEENKIENVNRTLDKLKPDADALPENTEIVALNV